MVLQVVEFLLCGVDSFLFLIDLVLVLGVFLVPGTGVAHAIAGIGVEGSGAQAVFALHYIKFASQQIEFIFLCGNTILPGFIGFLLGGRVILGFVLGIVGFGRRFCGVGVRSLGFVVRLVGGLVFARSRVDGLGVGLSAVRFIIGICGGVANDAELVALG